MFKKNKKTFQNIVTIVKINSIHFFFFFDQFQPETKTLIKKLNLKRSL